MIIGALAGAAAASVVKQVQSAVTTPSTPQPATDPARQTTAQATGQTTGQATAQLGDDAQSLLLQSGQDTASAAQGGRPAGHHMHRAHAAYARTAAA